MARVQTIKSSFNAGELSPKLYGQVELARYKNATEIMEGMYCQVHGGAARAPGTVYVADTKFHVKRSRLIPFVFSTTQAYELEFGDAYMRVFKDNGQVLDPGLLPYEIVSPYLEAHLPAVNYVQSADTMFLVHGDFQVRKLSRSGHAAWNMTIFPFVVEPHDEAGTRPAAALTLSALTGAITVTAGATVFELADVGRQIISGTGIATITAYTSQTVVSATVIDAFASTSIASGAWTLTESPKATLTPSVAGAEGAPVTLTLDIAGWKNSPTTDVGRYVHVNGGMVEITAFTSPTVVSGLIRAALSGIAAAPPGSWSMESRVWSAENGYPRAVYLFQQRLILGGTTAYPNRWWASRTARYNDFTTGALDTDGLDFDLVSDQQNPIAQISALRRAIIFMTYGGEFSAAGGVEKPIAPTNVQLNPESQYGVRQVRPVRVGSELLFVQRAGRKVRSLGYRVEQDAYGSPDITILSEHITESGVTEMAYAQEPDSVVWMTRADGVGLALTLSREQEVIGWTRRLTDGAFESFSAHPYGDIDQAWTIVNRTIGGATKRYVERLDAATNTDSCLTGEFAAIALTAISWAAGSVTATTLSAHGLGVGNSVRIAGVTPAAYNGDKVCIAGTAGSTIVYALETDPGAMTVLGTATPLAETWTGFGHLEGKTLAVLADGVVFPPEVVSGGAITLPRAVATLEAGLAYQSRVRPLTIELQMPGGTAQGLSISVNEMTLRLYQSVGGTIKTFSDEGVEKSSEDLPYRAFGPGVLAAPLEPLTRDLRVNTIGWGKRWTVELQQNQPLPFCVSALIAKVTVND